MPGNLEIFKDLVIEAPASGVWRVLTDPELIKLWLFEENSIQVEADWRTGGSMRFDGHFHGIEYAGKGHILILEPLKHFRYDFWNSLSQLPDEPAYYFIVDFRLQEHVPIHCYPYKCQSLPVDALIPG
jgi:hypothetical protein